MVHMMHMMISSLIFMMMDMCRGMILNIIAVLPAMIEKICPILDLGSEIGHIQKKVKYYNAEQ